MRPRGVASPGANPYRGHSTDVGLVFLVVMMFKRSLPRGRARYRAQGTKADQRRYGTVERGTASRAVPSRAGATRPPTSALVASPGGWLAPAGTRPGWDWTPPPGITPRTDRMRWPVRLWARTPVLDRFAYAWMWSHGGFDVEPAR